MQTLIGSFLPYDQLMVPGAATLVACAGLQVGCADQEDLIRPYACLRYALDEPSAPARLEVQLPGRRRIGEFDLDKVRPCARPPGLPCARVCAWPHPSSGMPVCACMERMWGLRGCMPCRAMHAMVPHPTYIHKPAGAASEWSIHGMVPALGFLPMSHVRT